MNFYETKYTNKKNIYLSYKNIFLFLKIYKNNLFYKWNDIYHKHPNIYIYIPPNNFIFFQRLINYTRYTNEGLY